MAWPSDRINIIPGTTVTVIDPRDEVLGFADRELAQALCYSMRKNGARFLLGEKVRRCYHRGCASFFFRRRLLALGELCGYPTPNTRLFEKQNESAIQWTTPYDLEL